MAKKKREGKDDDTPNQLLRSVNFLIDLNNSYKTLRGVIMLLKPLPVHGELYPMIVQEEKQMSFLNIETNEPSTALLA